MRTGNGVDISGYLLTKVDQLLPADIDIAKG